FHSGSPRQRRARSGRAPMPPSPLRRSCSRGTGEPARAAPPRPGRTRHPQRTKAPPPSSCYSAPWRNLPRRANAGYESLNHSEITPPNFHHIRDGTFYFVQYALQPVSENGDYLRLADGRRLVQVLVVGVIGRQRV